VLRRPRPGVVEQVVANQPPAVRVASRLLLQVDRPVDPLGEVLGRLAQPLGRDRVPLDPHVPLLEIIVDDLLTRGGGAGIPAVRATPGVLVRHPDRGAASGFTDREPGRPQGCGRLWISLCITWSSRELYGFSRGDTTAYSGEPVERGFGRSSHRVWITLL